MFRPEIFRTQAALTSAAFLFAATLAGCAGPDGFGGSRQAVEEWVQPRGFVTVPAGTPDLPMLALARGKTAAVLHVYIEGDGAAWPSPFHPPRDPTPDRPVALALAARDPAPAVVYLGRPCQFPTAGETRDCPLKYWTSHRFAAEVVEAYRQTLDALKTRSGAGQLRLFGYSGGGVLATLLAMSRTDVVQFVTIAAPVSVAEWTSWHQVTPLTGSLDPGEQGGPLPRAVHFVGGKDAIVPPQVVRGFANRSGGRLRIVEDFDHQCCWSRDWAKLLEQTQ
jgi:pimeloyl-ACP methyl ester carboxylesterase